MNRALGWSAAIGIVVAVVFGLVALPAALLLFGRGLFWPFVPRAGRAGRTYRSIRSALPLSMMCGTAMPWVNSDAIRPELPPASMIASVTIAVSIALPPWPRGRRRLRREARPALGRCRSTAAWATSTNARTGDAPRPVYAQDGTVGLLAWDGTTSPVPPTPRRVTRGPRPGSRRRRYSMHGTALRAR
jgi:hypothetical protein